MNAEAIFNAAIIRPTKPGAYWVTGYSLDDPKRIGLVRVVEKGGILLTNLHQENTASDEDSRWYPLSSVSQTILFAGPLELPIESAAPSPEVAR